MRQAEIDENVWNKPSFSYTNLESNNNFFREY